MTNAVVGGSGASPGRPPAARVGSLLAYNGRPVVAGVGSFVHPVSPRASVADLWSTLDIAADAGDTALQREGSPRLDAAARSRLGAYVRQARQYYEAVEHADPVAKPLLAYYFVLNTTKAFLTAASPPITESPGIAHGIAQQNANLASPYAFSQEHFEVRPTGVFQELARITGRGLVWRPGVMQFERLVPHLPESVDLYSSSFSKKPALVPIQSVAVYAAGSRPNRNAWLTVEVSRLALEEAGLSPRRLLDDAAAFADSFDLVDGGKDSPATYQLRTPVQFRAMPGPLRGLRGAFDRSLIVRNRTLAVRRDSITLSQHVELISSEALIFAVMLHLSNMVRYRPHHVEELRGSGYWWLFTSWVDRACENYLLAISSRISLEEHVIV